MGVQAVLDRLAQIEAAALAVYAAHGLPTRPGHYRKGPRARWWTFLAERLSPEDRWAEVLARPPEKGWRHAALVDLGRIDGRTEPAAASDALTRIGRLRAHVTAGEPLALEDLLDALSLPSPGPVTRARGRSRSRS